MAADNQSSDMLELSLPKEDDFKLNPKNEDLFKVPAIPCRYKGNTEKYKPDCKIKSINSKSDKTMVFIQATRKTWDASVVQMANSTDEQIRAIFKSMAKSIQSYLYLFFKCKKMEYPAENSFEDISFYIVDAMQYRFREDIPVLQQISIGIFHVLHMARVSFLAIKKKSTQESTKSSLK